MLTSLPLILSALVLLGSTSTDALPVDAVQNWRQLPVPAPNRNAVKRGIARGRSFRQRNSKRGVVTNPKVVMNPKNPFYSSSLAALIDSTTAASSLVPSSSVTSAPTLAPTSDAVLPPATTEAAPTTTSTTTTWVPPSSSSTTVPVSKTSEVAVLPPVTTQWIPTTTTSPPAQTTTTTTTTTITTTVAPSTTSSTASPAPTSPAPHIYTGGIATYFWQNGNAGNCGWYESDSTLLVALPTKTYANGEFCGRYVEITRTDTGASIQALVADSCPTCNNDDCLDLSWGAFSALGGTEDMGIFDISWYFLPAN